MRRFFLISAIGLIGLVGAIAAGCDSDKTLDPIASAMSFQEFPHAVGNWWQYEVVERDLDYYGETRYDTVLLTIVDSGEVLCDPTPCPDFFWQRWERRASGGTDSISVFYTEDRVAFEDLMISHTLLFPLVLGGTWIGTRLTDTTEVVDIELRQLGTGEATKCYVVWGSYIEANTTAGHRVTVAPDVGLVHMRLSQWANLIWEGVEQEWTLLEWQVQ